LLLASALLGCTEPDRAIPIDAVDIFDPAAAQSDTPRYGPPPNAAIAEVLDVIDGDTITVKLGPNIETVRLLGIDTPEKAGGPRPPECHGDESSRMAAELVRPATSVLLSRDTEARDTYGRLLAYVHLADSGRFVNLELLTSGAAVPLSIAPNTAYTTVFRQAGAEAERDDRGLWRQCGGADVLLDPGVGSDQ